MSTVIMQQTIAANDAISKDVTGMLSVLQDKAECRVYCDYSFIPGINSISKKDLEDMLSSSDNIVIYHHSLYWKSGGDLLKKAKCKIVFKYHNITPPGYFRHYDEKYFRFCTLGLQQTERFLIDYPEALWVGDSQFNISGIQGSRTEVCPPFNGVEELACQQPEPRLLERLKNDKRVKLLFVGRYAPNKGHKLLVDIVKTYVSIYGDDICLYMIGKKDRRLDLYVRELTFLVKDSGLSDNIKILGEISSARLVSYYKGCDLFVCASSHEGFCVPILEAQCFGIPIIARKDSAIPDTIGSNQLLLSDDPVEYAAAIKVLSSSRDFRGYLKFAGSKNFASRFQGDIIKERFLKILSDFRGR